MTWPNALLSLAVLILLAAAFHAAMSATRKAMDAANGSHQVRRAPPLAVMIVSVIAIGLILFLHDRSLVATFDFLKRLLGS
jgi:hypothetical protein